ncbi:GntR family transcriptional regulator, gluconate operon transcriptional repressor [Halobacillus dabanensis]|uniref:GntR family transcriptional regulator, gluconate operon transcriptional repressor n=1 Tax=Halobacillus dabanensis TaxID=240302 RepID=A0A1I3UV64_HALDA|nr:GntR family transcriptional regulator [Halobacillus dabanensis]SFJ86599.1 GntR family transcriptional regulator, gluconate operon transcriptional repressor [Halobacillus dabanensis]
MKDSSEFMYPLQWLSKASAGERVASELRMRIISGVIESGSILSENHLASEFSVSRSPVREALKVLSSENLIQLKRMGALVLDITEKDIQEMYDVRLLIESFVFERLVHMETTELVKDLSKIFEMMKIAVQYKDADEVAKQDLLFHETIIRSISHSHIQMIWDNLKPTLESLVLLSMRYRVAEMYEDFERILANHELYIEAIDKKDRDLMVQSLHLNFDDVVQGRVEELWMAQQTFTKGVEREDD